jgi:hypothetical protein
VLNDHLTPTDVRAARSRALVLEVGGKGGHRHYVQLEFRAHDQPDRRAGFGQFLIARMGALYEDYSAGPQQRVPFRHSTLR